MPPGVTWTAWTGSAGTSAVRLQRTAVLFVLPAGQAPVGVSGSTHATAGNTSTKIVRDAAGRVHMAWLDARRDGMPPRVLYRRATTAPQTGAVTWETAPVRVNDGRSEAHNAFLGIAASAGAVHFVWQANGSIRYRRLRRQDGAWVFDPIRDTPDAMRTYAGSREKGSAPRWYFLTTRSARELEPLVEGFGQDVRRTPSGRELSHVLKVFLIDRAGDVREIYSSNFLHPRIVLNDIETLLLEER